MVSLVAGRGITRMKQEASGRVLVRPCAASYVAGSSHGRPGNIYTYLLQACGTGGREHVWLRVQTRTGVGGGLWKHAPDRNKEKSCGQKMERNRAFFFVLHVLTQPPVTSATLEEHGGS